MKFKKAFAWILAVAMIISLMPSMAFATTTNSVPAVPTVATDDTMPPVSIKIEAKEDWTVDQTIKLTFNNAKWTSKPATTTTAGIMAVDGATVKEAVAVSDNSVEFTFDAGVDAKDVITLTFNKTLTAGSEEGPIEAVIDGLDSQISSSTLVVATAGSSNTVATVTGDVKTYGRANELPVASTIEIRETAVNSISDNQILKLTLPKGITWDEVTVSGNLVAAEKTFNADNEVKDLKALAVDEWYIGNGGRSAYVYVDIEADEAVREVLNITGKITIGKNASEGDVTVDVATYKAASGASISEASGLGIAIYGEESVVISTVDEEDIPTIYSGYEKTNKDKYTWVQITIKETVKDSLASGRYIDITLPEEVQVVTDAGIRTSIVKNAKIKDVGNYNGTGLDLDINVKDSSEFTITVPNDDEEVGDGSYWNANAANTWNIFIPITVQADYTGDIEATLSGAKAGIEDTTLLVAKAVSPITVETATTEVKNGVQKQAVADITITENEIGYIEAGTALWIDIDNLGLTNSLVIDEADVEVIDGDMEIGKHYIYDGSLYIPVKEGSTKVSTISITGVTVTLNRTLPEGGYDLLVDGTALCDNWEYKDGDFTVVPVKVKDYLVITTPAEGGVYSSVDSDFVIGETSFTVNGETYEMDAAAYIDNNNRTMVPIRYFAMACGIDEDAISWDQGTMTATITTPARVVKITMGQDTIWVSDGSNIQMDTVAVNEGSRIYVPARFLANALGYEVAWDAATQTVSIY